MIKEYIEEAEIDTNDHLLIGLYNFLGGRYFEDSLYSYPEAAVMALHALAFDNTASLLSKRMGEDKYEELCNMLSRMTEFCNWIKENETHLARLDLVKWRSDPAINKLSAERFILEKEKYELKLKHLKETKHFWHQYSK